MTDERKKLLFVCYGLGIGGIETCFVNLLNILPEERFQIDVLLMNPEYESKPKVKVDVHYLDSFQYVMNTTDTMHEIQEHGGILKNFGKFIAYCCFRLRVKLHMNAWVVFRKLPKHYDVAIAYSQNDYSPYYVIDKVDADKKVMWYHNGAYESTGKKHQRDNTYYLKFDKVIAVSSDCKAMLRSNFEFADGQLVILRNICDASDVIKKSNAFVPESFSTSGFHITTVGRMTKEKGADLAVETCREICKKKPDVRWHWVGDGNQQESIKAKVREYGLQNNFIFEGNQTNPYPYIKCAGIYIQPSYYEAYSTTVTEAKILCKPIVTTDVGGMRDQLKNGETGFIVPIDKKALVNVIVELMENDDLRLQLTNRLSGEHFDTRSSLQEYINTVF